MLSKAQTTDPEDPRGPSLWDPISRQLLRSSHVPAWSCPDPQEAQLLPALLLGDTSASAPVNSVSL